MEIFGWIRIQLNTDPKPCYYRIMTYRWPPLLAIQKKSQLTSIFFLRRMTKFSALLIMKPINWKITHHAKTDQNKQFTLFLKNNYFISMKTYLLVCVRPL